MDLDRRLRDAYSNTDSDTHANTYSDADANTHPDTNADTHARLQRLCRGHAIQPESSRHQRRRLLSMHRPRLVLFHGRFLLCAGHRFRMGASLDPGDIGIVRHTDATANADSYTNTDTHPNTNTNAYADAHTDAYPNAYPNADTYPHADAHACHLRGQIGTYGQGPARLLGKLGRRRQWRASRHGLDSVVASARSEERRVGKEL